MTLVSNARRARKPPPPPPQARGDAGAVKVCERAYEAWFAVRGSSDTETALSVFAAFLLADKINPGAVLASTDQQIVKGIKEVWGWFWIRRPDLCNLCGPMAGWINEDETPADVARAVGALARAAVKAGITGLLGDMGVDLLGHAYVAMRPKSARDARGEFYSPGNLCDMMAQMVLGGKDDLKPGMSIAEPAAGTGGMVRAAAQHIRTIGMDPAEFWWVVNDISPLVVAALAVNCHVWGLGPNVVIGAADSLAEPDWPARAWKTQRAAVEHRDELLHHATILALLKGLDLTFTGGGMAAAGEPAAVQEEPEPIPGPVPDLPDIELPSDGSLFTTGELETLGDLTSLTRHTGRTRKPRRADDDPDAPALFLTEGDPHAVRTPTRQPRRPAPRRRVGVPPRAAPSRARDDAGAHP